MRITLKPLSEQVVVITGASSGIGLCTAQMAARAGARVVLSARNEQDLQCAVSEIRAEGGDAVYAVADVANPAQVEGIASTAIDHYGRMDTWVNNAAVSMYGRILEIEPADMRRQFDVNFWGVVHGSRTAVPHLRREGGALINVASVLADRAIPLQGIYCAAKHAVKAFTDSLRMELEAEGAPISISLVKPGSTDTPFFEKARNYMDKEPQPVPPVHAPEVAAEVILHCATHPVRDVLIGGMGKAISVLGTVAPRLTDYYMERTLFEDQKTDRPASESPDDNLYAPVQDDGGVRGRFEGRVLKSSAYTTAALHPMATALVLAGLGAAFLGIARRR